MPTILLATQDGGLFFNGFLDVTASEGAGQWTVNKSIIRVSVTVQGSSGVINLMLNGILQFGVGILVVQVMIAPMMLFKPSEGDFVLSGSL